MLDGQLPESAKPTECEALDAAYAVGVQCQLAQVTKSAKRVGGQVR